MTKQWRIALGSLCSTLLLASMSSAHAASISVLPPGGPVVYPTDTTAALDLVIDFTGEPTVGGGIGLTVSGPISNISFTPSAFFNSLDSSFSGHGPDDGSATPAAEYEIHFGDFGLVETTGPTSLGTITVDVDGAGLASVIVNNNEFWGGWPDDGSGNVDVTFNSANFEIALIPVPAAVWLFGSALGLLTIVRRRVVS